MARGLPGGRRAIQARAGLAVRAGLHVPLQRHRLHPARRAGPARERRAARPLRAEAVLRAARHARHRVPTRPPRGASASRPPRWSNGQGPLRGVVHDGNARLLGGVAGHAGAVLDRERPGRFCRMLLAGGQLGRPALPEGGHGAGHVRAARDRRVHARARLGHLLALLAHARRRSSRRARWATPASPAPSIWIDPATGVYMILLTNRVHPYGKGDVAELRRRISAAVGTRFAPRDEPTVAAAASRSRADEPGGGRRAAPARGLAR